MPSRHTAVEITSAQIKRLELSLQTAFKALGEWQKLHVENVVEWKDTFKLPAEEKYAALVRQMDAWDAPESQIPAILGIFDGLDVVKELEKQLFKQHSRKQPGEKIMAVERSEKHQPTVAELREHGKHEPEWVQEASAYHRSRDPGEFSDERRGQIGTAHAPAKEHAKHDAVRELDRDDEYEMG